MPEPSDMGGLGTALLQGVGEDVPEIPDVPGDEDELEQEFSPGEIVALDDMMTAIRSGNAKEFGAALNDFLRIRGPG